MQQMPILKSLEPPLSTFCVYFGIGKSEKMGNELRSGVFEEEKWEKGSVCCVSMSLHDARPVKAGPCSLDLTDGLGVYKISYAI